MTVGGAAFFRETVFNGGVDFIAAQIDGNLELTAAIFTDPDQTVAFNSMAVGGHALFGKTVFAGNVDFGATKIDGDLEFDGAAFIKSDPDARSDFSNIEVRGTASLQNARFDGLLDLSGSSSLDLMVSRDQSEDIITPAIDFSRSNVSRNFELKNIQVDKLIASSMRVGGTASISNLAINNSLNLEDASFLSLDLDAITLPGDPSNLTIDGMEYRMIKTRGVPPDNPETLNYLLALANRSEYSAQVYRKLEQFFADRALVDFADRVYIDQRQRLRRESDSPLKKFGDYFLEYTVGYGRRPELAFIWSAVFVVIGFFVFRHAKDMAPVEGKEGKHRNFIPRTTRRTISGQRFFEKGYYNPFWYSLDLFLPFVDLKMSDKWMPKPERRFARHYMRFQAIAGWILIPIAILSITGIIK
jgi:hypothetical protein